MNANAKPGRKPSMPHIVSEKRGALARLFNSRPALTVSVLALALFAAHALWAGIGFNIVLRNYFAGGLAFLDGQDPYAATLHLGPANFFTYSPQFALLAGLVARAGIVNNSVLPWVPGAWALGSAAMFVFGLCRWHDFSKSARPLTVSVCTLLALAAAATDALVSIGVYQINAFCIGLVLAGLAEYRDGRHTGAGALLLLAANLKIYPVVFLGALALRMKPKFWLGTAAAGITALLLPALFVGWTHNLETHFAWLEKLSSFAGTYEILSLRAAFERMGWWETSELLHWLVVALTVSAFAAGVSVSEPDWRPWFACGAAAILLLSPKTEVYTYVFLAPAYPLMVDWCAVSASAAWRKGGVWLFALSAALIASARFVDPLWFKSENSNEIIRVLGALVIWGASAWILLAGAWRFWMKPADAHRRKK